MQVSNSFKKTFLNLMINGLKQDGLQSKSMSIQEKKSAIKRSSYASMALARGPTRWSIALMKKLSRKEEKSTINGNESRWKIPACKKIVRRSLRSRSRKKNAVASVLARRMVKKRTRLLERIIPGGESLDGPSLLSETLDYVIHLKAQVNLMQCLAKALGASNLKNHYENRRSTGRSSSSVGYSLENGSENRSQFSECKREKDEQLACHDFSEMGTSTILQPGDKEVDSSNGAKKVQTLKCNKGLKPCDA